jgi:hypothetical protein
LGAFIRAQQQQTAISGAMSVVGIVIFIVGLVIGKRLYDRHQRHLRRSRRVTVDTAQRLRRDRRLYGISAGKEDAAAEGGEDGGDGGEDGDESAGADAGSGAPVVVVNIVRAARRADEAAATPSGGASAVRAARKVTSFR